MVLKIKRTPLSLVIDLPLAHEHDSLLPSWVLFFLIGLIIILLVSLSFLLKAELRVSALRKQVAEEERLQRIKLEKMTAKLDNEIRERTRAQIDTAKKNELLEGVRELLTDALSRTTVSGAAASGLEVARKLTKSRFGVIANPQRGREDQRVGLDPARPGQRGGQGR